MLTRLARFPLAVVTLAAAAIVALTGDHPPLGTSARYVLSAREMVEGGDWLLPHLCHVVFFDKPPLATWLGALSQWAFGGGRIATQLPASLSMLVMLLATAAIGTRWRGPAFGLGAALLLAASGVMLVAATTLMPDPVLAACLAAASWAFVRWLEAGATRWRLLFWLALALGVLVKGPIALVLPGLAIAGHALLEGGWRGLLRRAREIGPLTGAATVLAVNLPWTLLVWRRDPRLIEYFYVECNLRAFFDAEVHHPGPWWYYVPGLLLSLAPASLLLLPASAAGCAAAIRARRGPDRIGLFLASAALFPLLFLSAAASKLLAYAMPLLPALVLVGLERLVAWDARRSRAACVALASSAALLFVAVVAAAALATLDPARLPEAARALRQRIVLAPAAFVAVGAFLAALAASFALARRRRLLHGVAALAAGGLLLVGILLPRAATLAPELDPRPALAALATERKPDEPLLLHERAVQQYLVHEAIRERMRIVGRCRELGIGHFIEVRGPDVPLPGSFDDVSATMLPDHPWLLTREQLASDWSGSTRLWLIGDERILAYLRARGLELHEKGRVSPVVLVSNRP